MADGFLPARDSRPGPQSGNSASPRNGAGSPAQTRINPAGEAPDSGSAGRKSPPQRRAAAWSREEGGGSRTVTECPCSPGEEPQFWAEIKREPDGYWSVRASIHTAAQAKIGSRGYLDMMAGRDGEYLYISVCDRNMARSLAQEILHRALQECLWNRRKQVPIPRIPPHPTPGS